jgi:CO/xanthine dehydrogenase Mo-binding subunit
VSQGPALGAIANAVAHALGARIRDLPMIHYRIATAAQSLRHTRFFF